MTLLCMRRLASILVLGLLASCGNEKNEQASTTAKTLLGAVKQYTETRREGPRPKTVVTPEMLAQTNGAALQANPEQKGGSDFLRRVAMRNDSSIGTVEIWNSSDSAQIFLRNGVVVGTRGIGGDIIAADASMTVRALNARSGATGVRTYTISDGDTTTTEFRLRCEVKNLGAENVSIVNQVITMDLMREDCVGGPRGDTIVKNDYWVQRGTGLVRKSRQWMGPNTGYFELILLKN